MLRDIHHAWRTLSRQRATHAVVLLVVATALGAATAIFSLVDAALLRPLPYPEPPDGPRSGLLCRVPSSAAGWDAGDVEPWADEIGPSSADDGVVSRSAALGQG